MLGSSEEKNGRSAVAASSTRIRLDPRKALDDRAGHTLAEDLCRLAPFTVQVGLPACRQVGRDRLPYLIFTNSWNLTSFTLFSLEVFFSAIEGDACAQSPRDRSEILAGTQI